MRHDRRRPASSSERLSPSLAGSRHALALSHLSRAIRVVKHSSAPLVRISVERPWSAGIVLGSLVMGSQGCRHKSWSANIRIPGAE